MSSHPGIKISDAAKRTGLSARTLLRWTKPNSLGVARIRAVRRGNAYFLNPDDVEAIVRFGSAGFHILGKR
ncbi:MAG: helix-turn-helix domain-containing protein [Puniceicoccales bacterium]|nr:helix-turn-helix domain-containing protein [Puniceicoccales bacterium]